MSVRRWTTALVMSGICAGCSSYEPELPSGLAAYDIIAAQPAQAPSEYRIGALDVLRVSTFQEPELTFDELRVDAAGNLPFPLVGEVRAEGKTARELSREIATGLGSRYLVDPQVSVAVVASASQSITVEGNVTDPGVYEIGRSATLLEALARAKSPTQVAKLDQVVVFRMVNGQRAGAVFDVTQIRAGLAPDPQILGGDVVVVGFDGVKGAFRDFLGAAPLFNVFRLF